MKFLNYYFFILVFSSQLIVLNAQTPSVISKEKTEQSKNIKSVELTIGGMTCQKGCADGIDKKLKKVNGVIKSQTKLESGISKITYDESKVSLKEIITVIEERGYTAKALK